MRHLAGFPSTSVSSEIRNFHPFHSRNMLLCECFLRRKEDCWKEKSRKKNDVLSLEPGPIGNGQ